MKFHIVIAAFVFGYSSYVSAGCVGQIVNGECRGAYIDNPGVGSNSGYQGSSGARYQYNMNNPSDSLRYSTDLNAQRRDRMNVSPNRSLDQGLGQFGGGIYDDD